MSSTNYREQGRNAFSAGKKSTDNPYVSAHPIHGFNPNAALEWQSGYEERRQALIGTPTSYGVGSAAARKGFPRQHFGLTWAEEQLWNQGYDAEFKALQYGVETPCATYVVACSFQHDLRPELGWRNDPKKKYHYLCNIPNIGKGDIVVVDSPTTSYTCVKVVDILNYNTKHASKWVIQKVDDAAYKLHQQRLERAKDLKKQLDNKLKSMRAMMQYEMLFEQDPAAKAMAEELKALGMPID